jgi:hypothetical protein
VQSDYSPRQFLSASATRNTAVINQLTGSVTNPCKGLLPNSSSLNGSTVALDQLLTPYPQYPVGSGTTNGILEDFVQTGESYFNSLNVRLQKRMSHGLLPIDNFVWSNMMERMDYLNDSDPSPEKRIAADSRPLREVLAASYQLPIGAGRQVNIQNRWVNALAGGWLFNPVLTLQSGPPIAWTTRPLYYGGPLNLNPNQPNGTAFNTSVFNTVTADQLADNIRTFSTQFGGLRRAPSEELNLSMDKRFVLGHSERRFVALRIEAYNATNHVTFGPPNVTPTSSAFGEITTQANTPRRIQTAIQIFW